MLYEVITLVDMRFVKPLDQALIAELAARHELLVTLEDHALAGGAGSAVGEWLSQEGIECALLMLGIPDRWIEHDSREAQLTRCGLDQAAIAAAIEARLRTS